MSRRDRGRPRRLRVIPITYRAACAFLRTHGPDLAPPHGHRFSLGLTQTGPGGTLVGVAMVGQPVARHRDDGLTAQVTRLCTDATPHACGALLAAAWRTGRAMGYQKMITYMRQDEPGTSLYAVGWRQVAQRPVHPGGDRPSRRPRSAEADPAGVLWQVTVADHARRPDPRPDPTPRVSPPGAGIRLRDRGT